MLSLMALSVWFVPRRQTAFAPFTRGRLNRLLQLAPNVHHSSPLLYHSAREVSLQWPKYSSLPMYGLRKRIRVCARTHSRYPVKNDTDYTAQASQDRHTYAVRHHHLGGRFLLRSMPHEVRVTYSHHETCTITWLQRTPLPWLGEQYINFSIPLGNGSRDNYISSWHDNIITSIP